MTKERKIDIALFLLIALVVVMFTCNRTPKPIEPINVPTKAQDSFRVVIKYRDSVRIKDVLKWRTLTRITDSVPCYTEIVPFIQACDTIIIHDSILISTMDKALDLDSTVQRGLISRIQSDSVKIVKLNRKVKRNRRIALFFGAVVAGGVGLRMGK